MEHDEEDYERRTYELTRQNNKILRQMRRSALFGSIFKLLFWAVLIGIPVLIYLYFLRPVVNETLTTINEIKGVGSSIQQVGTDASVQLDGLRDILDSIPGIGGGGEEAVVE